MIQPPEHLQHLSDYELRDRISHQENITFDLIDHAQQISKSEEHELKSLDGLYFADLRYRELVAEQGRRLAERSTQLDNRNEAAK